MEMTKEEILRDFQTAKDKREQVKILAQLNLCKPEAIIDILKEMGEDGRQFNGRVTRKPKEPKAPTAKGAMLAEFTPSIKPRDVHDWERMIVLTNAVCTAVRAGEQPNIEWVREIDEIFAHYYTKYIDEERGT